MVGVGVQEVATQRLVVGVGGAFGEHGVGAGDRRAGRGGLAERVQDLGADQVGPQQARAEVSARGVEVDALAGVGQRLGGSGPYSWP